MEKVTISPRELARQRQVSLDYIYRELWAGKVPGARKVGKQWLIPDSATQETAQRRTKAGRE